MPVRRHYGVFLIPRAQSLGAGFDLHPQFSRNFKRPERKKVSKNRENIPVFVKFSADVLYYVQTRTVHCTVFMQTKKHRIAPVLFA
jgi:hypothetical protein